MRVVREKKQQLFSRDDSLETHGEQSGTLYIQLQSDRLRFIGRILDPGGRQIPCLVKRCQLN